MLPPFLIPILKEAFSFFTSKTGLIVLGIIALAIAIPVEILHYENVGAAKELAKEKAATAAEHGRRERVLSWAQEWAQGAIANVDKLETHNAELQAKLNTPAPGDDRGCVDRDDVRSLNGMRRNRDRPAAGH